MNSSYHTTAIFKIDFLVLTEKEQYLKCLHVLLWTWNSIQTNFTGIPEFYFIDTVYYEGWHHWRCCTCIVSNNTLKKNFSKIYKIKGHSENLPIHYPDLGYWLQGCKVSPACLYILHDKYSYNPCISMPIYQTAVLTGKIHSCQVIPQFSSGRHAV